MHQNKELSEYESLDRYITNYTADRNASGGEDDGADQRPAKRWWQFWKSSPVPSLSTHLTTERGAVPATWLDTAVTQGLSSEDIEIRRKRFGYNELVAEKENYLAKFASYFQGPILYGLYFRFTLLLGGR